MIDISLSSLVFAALLAAHNPKTPAPPPAAQATPPVEKELVFKNRSYHFSFSIPQDWQKQSGNPHGDNVLFTQMPVSDSCSFQFNITPMAETFPAEAAVQNGLQAAFRLVKKHQLLAARARNTELKEKVKIKNKEVEKITLLTKGWEITEKPLPKNLQKIIYQAYDRNNRYFKFVAFASSEKFSGCELKLRRIMASISFLPF
jgi:hypothetical protein